MCVCVYIYTGSSTNNTPVLLQNLLLQNHKHVILYYNNITLQHTIWHFRWNVQIKNYKLLQPYYYPTNHPQAGLTSAGPCI